MPAILLHVCWKIKSYQAVHRLKISSLDAIDLIEIRNRQLVGVFGFKKVLLIINLVAQPISVERPEKTQNALWGNVSAIDLRQAS
jgi:hypothetical protein